MSMSHLIILGIIALIVIPPDKLPEVAKQVAKFIYDLKRNADELMTDLKREAMFKPDDVIDKSIKEKLEELHRQLNESPVITPPSQAPVAENKDEAPKKPENG